ncbi:carbohydrate kinase family protein [Glycomyces xiaoerkulensis]|uniref:hypothetical protein n=1 Tax=Glycomyces xiaoerkulensis TaxID=2038139 RepID=UPI000C25FD3C|nr:hypothetical protein [Glycomyces xiaoerkulensis]
MKTAVTGSTAPEIAYGIRRLGGEPITLESGETDLIDVMERTGPLGLVHIGADEPKAMLSLAEQCRELDLEFSADPTGLEGGEAVEFIGGAKFLVTSTEGYQFLQATTGLDDDGILSEVRVRVTDEDAEGVEIAGHDMDGSRVPVARAREPIDPAGVHEAFTAGLLACLGWGMSLRRAAEVGGQLGVIASESVGTRYYSVNPVEFVQRLEESYGAAAAAEASAYVVPD